MPIAKIPIFVWGVYKGLKGGYKGLYGGCKLGKFLWKVFREFVIVILGKCFGDLGGIWGGKPLKDIIYIQKRYFTIEKLIQITLYGMKNQRSTCICH